MSLRQEDYDLRLLDSARVRLFRVAGVTRMTYEGECSWLAAACYRAFPLSDASHYIGFLDGDNGDIGMVEDPSGLDAESRRVLEEELELRYFTPVIRRVLRVKEEFGSVYWSIETDRGPREMIVRDIRDNLQRLGESRVLITDVDGNRFEIPDVDKLEPAAQNLIIRSV